MANPQRENGYTAISNEIMEALARIRIAGEARQMLDVIIRKTYGFNKRADRIATSQFKEFTGLSNMALHKAREKLTEMNLITVTKKGNSQVLTYSLQKDYDKWQPLPKKVTVTKKGNGCYQKRLQVLPKKVTNCYPKGDTQKKERNYTKETLTKEKKNCLLLQKLLSLRKEVSGTDEFVSLLTEKGVDLVAARKVLLTRGISL